MAEQDKVPPLKYWSDVAFLQWVDVAHAYEKHFQNIKHFVILGIDNDYTLQIIWQVLYNKGRGGHPYQSIDEAATIPMSDPDGQALLASPNARGCAQFLLTHKPQLGLKMITGVKIFGPDYISQEIGTAKPPKGFNRPEMVGVPSGNPGLVFFVEDVTSPET